MSSSNQKEMKARVITVNVKTGQLAVNPFSHQEVNRIISVTEMADNTRAVKLLIIPGDVWRFTSSDELDLGSQFTSRLRETTHKYCGVNPDFNLTTIDPSLEPDYCRNEAFKNLSTHQTLIGDTYKKMIDFLTKGMSFLNITNHDSFNLRNMTGETSLGFGFGMYISLLEFECINDSIEVKTSKPITIKEANEITKAGVQPMTAIMRQQFGSSNTVMFNFHKDYSEVLMTYIANSIRELLPNVKIEVTRNRYNINIDIEKLLDDQKPTNDQECGEDDLASVQVPEAAETCE